MIDDEICAAVPIDVRNYHERQAAHFRALAGQATTGNLKRRLLDQAEEHEQRAEQWADAS